MITLYITGAGVSKQSGIPTFRGEDGFWTIGSTNYTPQEMATRQIYRSQPDEFLLWYYKRFVTYKDVSPNRAHQWLSDKRLITQNIDGLDGKAGNKTYIPIHGRLDRVTVYSSQEQPQELLEAPWEDIEQLKIEVEDHIRLTFYILDHHAFQEDLVCEVGGYASVRRDSLQNDVLCGFSDQYIETFFS